MCHVPLLLAIDQVCSRINHGPLRAFVWMKGILTAMLMLVLLL